MNGEGLVYSSHGVGFTMPYISQSHISCSSGQSLECCHILIQTADRTVSQIAAVADRRPKNYQQNQGLMQPQQANGMVQVQ